MGEKRSVIGGVAGNATIIISNDSVIKPENTFSGKDFVLDTFENRIKNQFEKSDSDSSTANYLPSAKGTLQRNLPTQPNRSSENHYKSSSDYSDNIINGNSGRSSLSLSKQQKESANDSYNYSDFASPSAAYSNSDSLPAVYRKH
ncbi:MAG: hypothetical protein LBL82_06475 [Oscillospiraceae bacterium]|nr:hypothetical protein [Oscillospiraceae bacterium]